MRNQLNFIKRVLYRLRQDYGRTISLVEVTGITTDYKTGEQTQTTMTYTINKVVKLTKKMSSFIRVGLALGIFNRGGSVDKTIMDFLFDAKVLPVGIEPNMREQYIICDSQRFNIISVARLEGDLGYLVSTEAIEGAEQ
jgi:hypothetical protein